MKPSSSLKIKKQQENYHPSRKALNYYHNVFFCISLYILWNYINFFFIFQTISIKICSLYIRKYRCTRKYTPITFSSFKMYMKLVSPWEFSRSPCDAHGQICHCCTYIVMTLVVDRSNFWNLLRTDLTCETRCRPLQ